MYIIIYLLASIAALIFSYVSYTLGKGSTTENKEKHYLLIKCFGYITIIYFILTIPIFDDGSLIMLFINILNIILAGVLIGKDEGIITQEGLVKFVERGSLKEYFNFNLVDVELMYKYLKDPSIRNLPEDCYIEKPYSQNIVIEDINKYAFIKDRIGLDGDIVDYIGTYHAVGVQLGYIKGNITDKEFDLKKLLEALKKREDIIFVNGAKIEPITCQYGYNEDEHETINFIWLPSEEDHEKCIDYYGNFNVYDAPEKVFCVKRYNNYVI